MGQVQEGTVSVAEFITDGEQVARRSEVLGLLLWIERKRRSNTLWRRVARWIWLRIPLIPKPEVGSAARIVDRDPYRLLEGLAAYHQKQELERARVESVANQDQFSIRAEA